MSIPSGFGEAPQINASLYERIGGEATVMATVVKLYQKTLDDPLLAPFFVGVNMDDLKRAQRSFVSFAFGGPVRFTGRDLRAAHRDSVRKGLSDMHFDALLHHLVSAMQELDIDDELIAEAYDIIDATRDDVLNR